MKEFNKSSFDLSGKNIVLVGAAGILGPRLARAFLLQHATVHLIDVNRQSLDELKTMFDAEYPEQCATYCVDITNKDQFSQVHQTIMSQCSSIEVLFNNAATKTDNFFEPFETFPIQDWDKIMGVNVKGAMIGSQLFGATMAEQGVGSIINTLSIYGIVAPDQRIYEGSEYLGRGINTPAIYSTSKAALWGLTKYLASYWGHKGVRVNAITPGGIQSGQNETFQQRYGNKVPLGRMADVDELCGAAVFLASDASSYITGQNIIVDGGFSVW